MMEQPGRVSKSKTHDQDSRINDIIFVVIVICLVGTVICMGFLIYQLVIFGAENKTVLSAISSQTKNPSADTEVVKALIAHMETMMAIQEKGLTNSLMSFVYGVLSTILVALCAKFVEKCSNTAKDASEAAQKAKDSEITIDNIHERIRKIDEEVTANVCLQKTYTCIIYAKIALQNLMNMTNEAAEKEASYLNHANTAFTNLRNSASDLKNASFSKIEILSPLIPELKQLKAQIEHFRDKYLPSMAALTDKNKGTLNEAATNYVLFTEKAIKDCETRLLPTRTKR